MALVRARRSLLTQYDDDENVAEAVRLLEETAGVLRAFADQVARLAWSGLRGITP